MPKTIYYSRVIILHVTTRIHIHFTQTQQKPNTETEVSTFFSDAHQFSFASGGDSDTLDYIAYVAKDGAGNGGLRLVTMTILTSDWLTGGRACYVLECTGGLAQDVITTIGQAFELRFKEFLKKSSGVKERPPPLTSLWPRPDDPEYYNDLPDKAAPGPMGHGGQVSHSGSSNLIDLSTEIGVESFKTWKTDE